MSVFIAFDLQKRKVRTRSRWRFLHLMMDLVKSDLGGRGELLHAANMESVMISESRKSGDGSKGL